MTQRVIEERELVVASQSGKPQRELRKINGHLVLVHAIKTTLSDQPAGMQQLVFIGRKDGVVVMLVPGLDKGIAKLAARLHKESSRAHGWVATFKCENLFWRRVLAEILENGGQCGLDDRLGKRPWRVVGTAAATFCRRLEDHRSRREHGQA